MNEQVVERRDDEIDLRDLALVLVEGWYWIVGAVIAAVVLAGAYLAVTPAAYSTQIQFAPVSGGLMDLNAVSSLRFSSNQVKEGLAQRLTSYENFSRFIEAELEAREQVLVAQTGEREPEDEQRVLARFFQALNLADPGALGSEQRGRPRTLELGYGEDLAGASFLNRYYDWSEKNYIETLVERVRRARNSQIRENSRMMNGHLEAYGDDLASRIARLEEKDEIKRRELLDELEAEKHSYRDSRKERARVLSIAADTAKLLGIEKPTTPQKFGQQSGTGGEPVIYATLSTQNGLPLYFMGTEALMAEKASIESSLEDVSGAKTSAIRAIEKQLRQLEENREVQALQAREHQAQFIDEYLELSQENVLLAANTVATSDVEVAEVLTRAYRPVGPDSPRKALVLVLAVMLGCMIGVFVAFFARFVSGMRRYAASSQGDA